MRLVFILMFAATVAETLVSLAVLPDRVYRAFRLPGVEGGKA